MPAFRPPRTPVAKAWVNIGSDPSSAQVFIDNALAGKTPLKIDIPLGKHEIRMSLPDYEVWEAQIDLDKPDDVVPLSVKLVPAGGG